MVRNPRKGHLPQRLVRFPCAQASISCLVPSIVFLQVLQPPTVARLVTRLSKPDSKLFGAELRRSTHPHNPLPTHARAPDAAPFILSMYPADPLVPPHPDSFFFREHIRGHEAYAIADTGATDNFTGFPCEVLYTLFSRFCTYWYLALMCGICGSPHLDSPGTGYAILCAI